ncbi:MAG: hypothetical protein HS127_13580 [Planctomycetia bacterium]|nr:hypothetical protein [Planctomycetia bacterium]
MFTSHFSMTTQPFSERINTSLIMKDERLPRGLHDSNTSYTQALSPSSTDRRESENPHSSNSSSHKSPKPVSPHLPPLPT